MKKKGFTLIELLAVIVILAIIALIATPLVLKYIESARTNSKIVSTQNYIKAVETALASYSIANQGKSYPAGCHEISKLNNDLDVSIKGDIPTSGTICIEDNKIKTANVKYPDNKEYKYEDGKVAISTGESNNTVIDYIIDTDVEFVYNESMSAYTATIPITPEIAEQFKVAMDYDFIIDNGEIETITGAIYNSNFMLYSNATKLTALQILENQIIIMSLKEITGVKNIKIGNPRTAQVRFAFKITDYYLSISSYDFTTGNANLVIKNEDNVEYYNGTVELMDNDGDGIIGIDNTCRMNIPKLPNVYNDLVNGKTITIEVRQVVDGKEIVLSGSGNLNSMVPFEGGYISNMHTLALLSMTGC